MYSWDRGSGRSQDVSDKLWQMLQSNDAKSENLVQDFAEIFERAHKLGWNESALTRREKA